MFYISSSDEGEVWSTEEVDEIEELPVMPQLERGGKGKKGRKKNKPARMIALSKYNKCKVF